MYRHSALHISKTEEKIQIHFKVIQLFSTKRMKKKKKNTDPTERREEADLYCLSVLYIPVSWTDVFYLLK